MNRRFALLRRYLSPHPRRVAGLALLVLGTVGLQLGNPQWLGHVVDATAAGAPTRVLLVAAFAFIALTVVNQVVLAAAGRLADDLGARTTDALRADLTARCLALDESFHAAHPPAELAVRIDGDTARLRRSGPGLVFGVGANLLLAVGVVGIGFAMDRRIGLVLLAFAAVVVPLLRHTRAKVAPRLDRLREVNGELASFLTEHGAAAEDIRGNAAEAHVLGRLDAILLRYRRASRLEGVAARAPSAVLEVAASMVTGAVLALGAVLLQRGGTTLGTVYLAYFYASLFSLCLFRITAAADNLGAAVASLDRAAEILDATGLIPDTGRTPFPRGAPEITFDRVWYSAVPNRPILRDVTFSVPAGRSVALVEQNGSEQNGGEESGDASTVAARLLHRTLEPTYGWIRVSGVDIREIPLNALRSRIGLVPRDVPVLPATVRENLTLFDAGIRDQWLWQALGELGCGDWVRALPDGMDTVLTDALPANQARLLALTRVYLRDPAVVILDRPAAPPDPETAAQVDSAVARLLRGRTALVIDPSPALLPTLDRVVVLDAGAVAAPLAGSAA